MALTVKEYISLDYAKTELGIQLADTSEDSFLETLIKAASRALDNYCKTSFYYEASITERYPALGRPTFTVKKTPLISVTSITDREDSSALSTSLYDIDDAQAGVIYVETILPDTGFHLPGAAQKLEPSMVKSRYEIDYEAGYETPEQSATGADPIPEDLQYACMRFVTDYYTNAGDNPRVKREHLLEAAVWYDNTFKDDILRELLRPYKRVAFA